MKVGFFSIAALPLLQLAAAQPRDIHHRHVHAKRDLVTQYATVTSPEVIVWVDQNGNTVSVETQPGAAAQTIMPSPQAFAERPAADSAPTAAATYAAPPTVNAAQSQAAAPPPPPPAAAPAAPPAPPPSSQGSMLGLGIGITYSPYNSDGTCKTQAEVSADFDLINGYEIVRIYGVDCNQLNTVIPTAKAKGMKVLAGLIDLSDVSGGISQMIAFANGDWSSFDTISIGNELVNTGKASVGQVVAAVNSARGQLKAAGYTGSVVTVDTFNAIIANPELCTVSDYCAANCHAFFNSDTEASGAGQFVLNQAKLISQAAGGKNTIITESGWPSQGSPNGKAIPSDANQAAAIASLRAAFSGNLFLFNAFNDGWKTDGPGTFNAEKFWGILN